MSTIEELNESHFSASRKYVRSMPTSGSKEIRFANLCRRFNNIKYRPQGRSGGVLYRLLSLQQTSSWRETFGIPMSGKAKGITVLPWETTEQ